MLDITAGAGSPDNVAHVIQVSLAPVFLLTALATLLGIFSTRLARVADQVDAAARDMLTADAAEARSLSVRLSHLRRRSTLLDVAVALACLGGVMTAVSIMTLFVGALRDAATASVLFACFGAALISAIGALGGFLAEILMASSGVRVEVDRRKDEVAARVGW